MSKQIPSYLKLVTDTTSELPAAESEDLAGLLTVCRAFERATGWQFDFAGTSDAEPANNNLMWSAPVNPGVGTSPGHIRLFSTDRAAAGNPQPVELESACDLASAVGGLWGELLTTRRALRQREAELAAGIPLVVHADDTSPALNERLEAVLKGGAQALGCEAIGLYLLDPATTELKLRASWGLAERRLAEPARPLRGALADLEALLGHAVVLADDEMHEYWKVPERGFASCVCVPVSSPSMPLGTLWAFCREARDFNAAQTNILEVVAGRIAADLERQVLLDEAVTARSNSRELATAGRAQQDQMQHVAPLVDGWELSAVASHVAPVGGTFYDWFELGNGSLAVVAGDALCGGISGAMTAAALQATARALCDRPEATDVLLEKANTILWSNSAGDARAALLHASVCPGSEWITLALAGPLRALVISGVRCTRLAGTTRCLGTHEQLRPQELRHMFNRGELLLVYNTAGLDIADQRGTVDIDRELAKTLSAVAPATAQQLADAAAKFLSEVAGEESDRLVAVIRRR